jgi:multidrug efflux pump subunit AcrB
VTLDPAKMQAFGVTAPQVNAALRVLNLNAAGGKAEIGGTRQSVRVLGNAQGAYDLSQTEIPVAGRVVKLADIATCATVGRDHLAGQGGGKRWCSFIRRARGASDVSVYDNAVARSTRSRPRTPASISRCSSPRWITPRPV